MCKAEVTAHFRAGLLQPNSRGASLADVEKSQDSMSRQFWTLGIENGDVEWQLEIPDRTEKNMGNVCRLMGVIQ